MPREKKPAKRSNGEGSVYKVTRTRTTQDGRAVETTIWRGSITVDIVAGKQQRKYVTASTRADAAAKLRKLAEQRDAGTLPSGPSVTVGQWITYYLNELAPKKVIAGRTGNRRSTLTTYKGYARNWIIPHVGAKKLDRAQVEDFEKLYQAMADAGLAAATINQVHAIVRTACEVAYRRGRMPRNTAALAYKPAAKPAKPVRKTSAAEGKSILETALGDRMGARWVARLAYGLRQGEGLGLCWDDIDFEGEVIWIRQALARDHADHGCGDPTGVQKYRAGDGTVKERPKYPCGKAQAARCPEAVGGGLHLVPVKSAASEAPLPLPEPVAALLKQWRTAQKRERIQVGPAWKDFEQDGRSYGLVFTTPTGRPVEPRRDWTDWYDLLERAGVEPVKPHAARHLAATLLVQLGVHPRTAMEMLRHADVTTTLNLYAKAPSADLRAAADALAQLLLGKKAAGE